MKRMVSLLLVIALLGSVLAACSGGTSNPQAQNPGSSSGGSSSGTSGSGSTSGVPIASADAPAAAEVLATAKKYFQLAKSKAGGEDLLRINELVTWQPDFSGKSPSPVGALEWSYPAAFLTTYTNLKCLYLALNAAAFALDHTSPVAAGNLASAIVAYAEDAASQPIAAILTDSKQFTSDAAAVYRYALAHTSREGVASAARMPVLLNYGYLCIDTGDLETARQMFEEAVELDPEHFPAQEGLAAYWLAAGNKAKAEEILRKATKPGVYGVIARGHANTDKDVAPEAEEADAIETIEAKLDKLAAVPVLLATDFYEQLDPQAAADARRFVDELAAEWTYTAPDYAYLAQYSTLEAFNSGLGQAAWEAFEAEFAPFSERYAQAMVEHYQEVYSAFGIDVNAGTIQGMDPEAFLKSFSGGQTGGPGGSSWPGMATAATPEFTIFQMEPGNYANPGDLMTQQYNMTVLMRKLLGYKAYVRKQYNEVYGAVFDAIQKLTRKTIEYRLGMNAELEELRKKHESDHKVSIQGGPEIVPPFDYCDQCLLKKHAIHQEYYPQINDIAETVFVDATSFVNMRYKLVKPRIEQMYADCMRNCMLISDPAIRRRKELEIKSEVYGAVMKMLTCVVTAYGTGVYGSDYPFECDCDPEAVAAAQERERQAFEEAEYNRTIMENNARREFEAGIIKESTQLYQRLDKYAGSVKLLFMEGKWHPLKTSVKFNVKVPAGKATVGADFGWTTEHVRNTTTYGGGLSATLSTSANIGNTGDLGKIGASGTISLRGEVATDGSGNVVRTDFSGAAKVAASWAHYSAGAGYEVSTMRGSKVSAEVSKLTGDTLKPPNAVKAWGEFSKTAGIFLPAKPKKTLWNGTYKLSE